MLYQTYRPRRFQDVLGQEQIVTTLTRQLQTKRIGHGYLFEGDRGCGKTTIAKIFAMAVNCEHPEADGSPCLECPTCRAILAGHGDVQELDAASHNGVDQIRELIDSTQFVASSHYKVYIIDEVHMLSKAAFNALLKTLEEPPEHVIFILATTEVHKLPITVISRCQRFRFRRIMPDVLEEGMERVLAAEGRTLSADCLALLARAADGAMRDALSLLEQVLSMEHPTVSDVSHMLGVFGTDTICELLEFLVSGDISSAMRIVQTFEEESVQAAVIRKGFTDVLTDRLIFLAAGAEELSALRGYAEQIASLRVSAEQARDLLRIMVSNRNQDIRTTMLQIVVSQHEICLEHRITQLEEQLAVLSAQGSVSCSPVATNVSCSPVATNTPSTSSLSCEGAASEKEGADTDEQSLPLEQPGISEDATMTEDDSLASSGVYEQGDENPFEPEPDDFDEELPTSATTMTGDAMALLAGEDDPFAMFPPY